MEPRREVVVGLPYRPWKLDHGVWAPDWLLRHWGPGEISSGAILMFGLLSRHCGRGLFAYPSQKSLVDGLGISLRWVQELTYELKTIELIRSEKVGRKNRYWFLTHAWNLRVIREEHLIQMTNDSSSIGGDKKTNDSSSIGAEHRTSSASIQPRYKVLREYIEENTNDVGTCTEEGDTLKGLQRPPSNIDQIEAEFNRLTCRFPYTRKQLSDGTQARVRSDLQAAVDCLGLEAVLRIIREKVKACQDAHDPAASIKVCVWPLAQKVKEVKQDEPGFTPLSPRERVRIRESGILTPDEDQG